MGTYNVAPLERLVEQFEKMPGIGHKTAQRLAYYVLNLSKTEAESFSDAIIEAHEKIHYCSVCCNLTDKETCPVCASEKRDKSLICVVETPRDAMAMEATNEYKGTYHVLHGAISPLNDIGPDDLKIKELIARLSGEVNEVIMANEQTKSKQIAKKKATKTATTEFTSDSAFSSYSSNSSEKGFATGSFLACTFICLGS